MLRNLIAMGLISILLTACGLKKLERKGQYKELSGEKYNHYLNSNQVNLIDVRTPKEYRKSHIDGAVNASYFNKGFKAKIDSLRLDPSLPTLIYCETQHRSLFAAKILHKKGFKNIIDLDKGMLRWRKDSLPTIYPEKEIDSAE